MSNLIYTDNARTAPEGSNRLECMADHYDRVGADIDFNGCQTLEEVVEDLLRMAEAGLHLVGSHNYVYHSISMAECVMKLQKGVGIPLNLLTRSGNLRARVIQLLEEEI